MLTRKALNTLLLNVWQEFSSLGYEPERMLLFGSYAAGNPHQYSDIDIAVWNSSFSGEGMVDFEKIRSVYRKHRGVDIKTYPSGANADFDPFIDVIEKTGIEFSAPYSECRI